MLILWSAIKKNWRSIFYQQILRTWVTIIQSFPACRPCRNVPGTRCLKVISGGQREENCWAFQLGDSKGWGIVAENKKHKISFPLRQEARGGVWFGFRFITNAAWQVVLAGKAAVSLGLERGSKVPDLEETVGAKRSPFPANTRSSPFTAQK